MTENAEQRDRRRQKIMRHQGGLCFYCNQPMVVDGYGVEPRPPNQATFEHLDDKFDRARTVISTGRRVVLACHKCNNERNEARQKGIGIDELRERSGKFPMWDSGIVGTTG